MFKFSLEVSPYLIMLVTNGHVTYRLRLTSFFKTYWSLHSVLDIANYFILKSLVRKGIQVKKHDISMPIKKQI